MEVVQAVVVQSLEKEEVEHVEAIAVSCIDFHRCPSILCMLVTAASFASSFKLHGPSKDTVKAPNMYVNINILAGK